MLTPSVRPLLLTPTASIDSSPNLQCGLQAASDEAAALQAGVDGSLAAVVALQAQLETQPGCWETEISGAVAPLQWQLGEMDREQQATKQGLADLGEQVAAAEAAIAALREAAASSELRARWQADIEEAETALRDELSELEQQQQARAREDSEQLEEALDALNWRLKHAEASISAVGAHPMQWADDIEVGPSANAVGCSVLLCLSVPWRLWLTRGRPFVVDGWQHLSSLHCTSHCRRRRRCCRTPSLR